MEGMSEWVVRVKEEAEHVRLSDTDDDTNSSFKKCSIYRLPARVVNQKKEAYLPQWVSFRPYHHGEEHLKPMEEHKHRAFLYTLKRSNQNPECFVQAVEEVVDDLLDSYQSIDPYWRENRDAFVKLMILDGCFMLEILRKESFRIDYRPNSRYNPVGDYPPSDPVFGKHGDHSVVPYIRNDMIMLENQLPLLLLRKLATVKKMQEDVKFIHKLILKFWFLPVTTITDGCLHMLHLYKRGIFRQLNSRAPSSSDEHPTYYEYIGSATKLNQAGITFQLSGRGRAGYLNDVSFSKGILRLPFIEIDDTSELALLNLLAFERFHVGEGSEVASYVHFMSNIVQDVNDVRLLNSQRILMNYLGNDTKVVQLFNSASNDMAFDPENYLYKQVTYEVFRYRNSGWPRFRSSLIATYIREWPVLSAAAAAFLFILTITQTVYTVYSAYH